jgi:DNA-directed RNA polymerase specialized sigma24 family protein
VSRETARADFEEFVVVCSERLLRTAYLLTGSSDSAERLLCDALARAWFAWSHLDEPPEPFVRRRLVGAALRRGLVPNRMPQGRRHAVRAQWARVEETDDGSPDLWTRLQRLSRRQRAVVVLHWYDGLTLDEAADLVGCSPSAARTIAAQALALLGVDPGPQPQRVPRPQVTS